MEYRCTFGNPHSNDQEETSSSDEKMDTGSEDIPSTQNTPNSVISSDFEEQQELTPEPVGVLRLQDPLFKDMVFESEEVRPSINNTDCNGSHEGIFHLDGVQIEDNLEYESDDSVEKLCNTKNKIESLVQNLVEPVDCKVNNIESKKSTNVLRLNNPIENNLLYRNVPSEMQLDIDNDDIKKTLANYDNQKSDSPMQNGEGVLNDSLMSKISNLRLNSLDTSDDKPLKSKLSSTLTLTSDHPLMGFSSPDLLENYAQSPQKTEQIKDSSLSSVEDHSFSFQDGVQRNTSKNNLYFSDNFSIAESTSEAKSQDATSTPNNVVENGSTRRKIVPMYRETEHIIRNNVFSTPQKVLGREVGPSMGEKAINAYVEERNNRKDKCTDEAMILPDVELSGPVDIPTQHDYQTAGPVDWVESPSHLRLMSNFELPIELTSPCVQPEECASPDAHSSSTQDGDRSLYKAMADPYTGNVALKHTSSINNSASRRRIIAVVDTEDRCSLDSASVSSINSEEVDPEELVVELKNDEVHLDAVVLEESARNGDKESDDEDSKKNTESDYSEPIAEYSLEEEQHNERNWLKIPLPTGGYLQCDMKVTEPYKRVLSHGGYRARGAHIIVFSACHLPDVARRDYSYVMDNLFLYVVYTLDRLVSDEYELVYLHGSASKHKMPNFHWLKKCYQLIDRRLRKSLKHLYLVHPTFWLKSIVFMSKPFISSKFSRKLSYVHSLAELYEKVPVERAAIPDLVKLYDETRNR